MPRDGASNIRPDRDRIVELVLDNLAKVGPRSYLKVSLAALPPGTVQNTNSLLNLVSRVPHWHARRDAALATWRQAQQDALAAQEAALAANPPPDPDPEALAALDVQARRRLELQAEIRGLRATVERLHRNESIYERWADLLRSETKPLPLAAHAPLKAVKGQGQHEVEAVVTLSDEHGDEVVSGAASWGTERYDYNVFRARLTRWVEVVTAYVTQHLPKHRFTRLWVAKLGDSINGGIHHQEHRNHFANSLRAAIAVGDAEAQALAALEPLFPGGVHVVAVSGNHPRTTLKKDFDDPHANLDFLVTTQLATRLARHVDAGRITVHAPRAYTAYMEVCGHLCCLNHGDTVRGTWGIPWYGFSKRENRVQQMLAQHDARVRYFFWGHHHTPMERRDVGQVESLHAGAWVATSPWSLEQLAAGGEPQAPLYVFDERFGRILTVPIFLRDPEREAALAAGAWNPPYGRTTALETVGALDLAADIGLPVARAEVNE